MRSAPRSGQAAAWDCQHPVTRTFVVPVRCSERQTYLIHVGPTSRSLPGSARAGTVETELPVDAPKSQILAVSVAISFVVIRSPAHAAIFAAGRSCPPQPQRSVEMHAWTSLALLHVTRPDPMFGRDIHTMLRGLRLDRYAFPLSAVRCPSRRRSR
jgi:hypothetical protein